MSKSASPKRYARAVFEIAREKDALDRWQSDLAAIAGLKSNAELMAALASTRVRFDAKKQLVQLALPGVDPLALNLVYLLTTRKSLDIVDGIATEYEKLANEHHGIATAEVTTAVAIDEDEKKRLADRLSAITGKQVIVKPRFDPSILGGIIARVEDKLLDGSTRSKLMALKQKMAR